jgi:hypothetical protein
MPQRRAVPTVAVDPDEVVEKVLKAVPRLCTNSSKNSL